MLRLLIALLRAVSLRVNGLISLGLSDQTLKLIDLITQINENFSASTVFSNT
jgi:hypothetical protein